MRLGLGGTGRRRMGVGSMAAGLCLLLPLALAAPLVADGGAQNSSSSSRSALAVVPRSELAAFLQQHRFLFVVGPFHSGTSIMTLLLGRHPQISGLTGTGKMENEGQHLQELYEPAKRLGGELFPLRPASFADESSPLVSDDSRLHLINAWAPFWNLSRPVLLEKSPRHSTMTRFFQALFGGTRPNGAPGVAFVVMLRHPLGASRYYWERIQATHPQYMERRCGAIHIRAWLAMMDALLADLTRLQRAAVVRFERWLADDPQRVVDRLLERVLDLPAAIQLNITRQPLRSDSKAALERWARNAHARRVRQGQLAGQAAGAKTQPQAPQQLPQQAAAPPRRRLLMFHGSREQVPVHVGAEWDWVARWQALVDMDWPSCQEVVARFETRVNSYGYSILDPTAILPTSVFAPYETDLYSAT